MKKGKLVTFLSIFLLATSLIGSIFLADNIASKLFNAITVITAIVGAIALFIQFKKDKQINEAGFIFDFSGSFYDQYNCADLVPILDDYADKKIKTINYEENLGIIIRYMQWVESIGAIIEKGTIDLKSIDQVLGYRFFIIVNNKEVQKKELIPYREHYIGTFKLYKKWYEYKKAHNLPIPLEKTSLHLYKEFDEIIEKFD